MACSWIRIVSSSGRVLTHDIHGDALTIQVCRVAPIANVVDVAGLTISIVGATGPTVLLGVPFFMLRSES